MKPSRSPAEEPERGPAGRRQSPQSPMRRGDIASVPDMTLILLTVGLSVGAAVLAGLLPGQFSAPVAVRQLLVMLVFLGGVWAGLPGGVGAALGAAGVLWLWLAITGGSVVLSAFPSLVITTVMYLVYGSAVGGLFAPRYRMPMRGRAIGVLPKASQFGSFETLLTSLASTVEVRDQHTQGHCQRVAENSVVLGRALGLSPGELDLLYWSGMLHDLGKIAVPAYILQKQGRLTSEEFGEIRRHPSYGADLLAAVSPEFRAMADIVRTHHERWDGQGYPLGYRGAEIPLLARIIAVVDVFEALTSDRPYRSPMAPEQAIQYIESGASSQFDPEVVSLFVALHERGDLQSSVVARGSPSVVGVGIEHASLRLSPQP